MKFKVSALILSCISFGLWADYNPYKFYFSVEQYPCIPFTTYFSTPTLSRDTDYEVLYGADLDFMMSAGAWYPPLYVEDSNDRDRLYLQDISIKLYKNKNEKIYHISAHMEILRKVFGVYEYNSGDVTIPQAAVEALFTKTAFPVKKFAENTTKNDYDRFGAYSMEKLSEIQNLNAFKAIVELANIAFKNKNMHIKLDENDLNIRFNFRRKWLSWDTWKRWEEWL